MTGIESEFVKSYYDATDRHARAIMSSLNPHTHPTSTRTQPMACNEQEEEQRARDSGRCAAIQGHTEPVSVLTADKQVRTK